MENKNFKDLGICEPILKAITDQNFKEPTEIQSKTIPLVINRRDVIGGSKTGSGKTLAFSCGIIQHVIPGQGIQALILVPTRELAEQVGQAFRTFSKYKKVNIAMVYGGVSIMPQIKNLQSADVVVGTPGRILDHMERKTISFKKVETLVLDEADLMLDMGFLPDVEKIIKQVPKQRQTLLFSATISNDIYYIKDKYMENPESVAVEETVSKEFLKQEYYDVPKKNKFALLVHLLKEDKDGLVMVFCNTRMNVDFVEKNLRLNKIKARSIHGGNTQAKRTAILNEFHSGKHQVLVCTDVAARGLDIKGVSHVYNYDTCKDPKQYVHRIGRTARAGHEGKAVTLLSQRDYENFNKVVDTNKMEIIAKKLPVFERVIMETEDNDNDRSNRNNFNNRDGRSNFG
ncbi:MAG: DEAD/DEAH box helicase, partial [Candidatus Nanoarchaeia archaeon]|nr:DEAD/DEAH box helicase [Candidatus Nanoarchaeia archaeon]